MRAVIASERFKDGYVSKKVEKWDQDIELNYPTLLKTNPTQPVLPVFTTDMTSK